MSREPKVWVDPFGAEPNRRIGVNTESCGFLTSAQARAHARELEAAAVQLDRENGAALPPEAYAEHDFEARADNEMGCAVCGEGICFYLHVRWCEVCDNREPECECEER